jgi:hypothetical protein
MPDWETALRARHPATSTEGVRSYYFSLDGGGRELVTSLIREREVDLMIEIGSFLCGSSIQWLRARSSLKVIGVDPWSANFAQILERYQGNPAFDPCFSAIADRGEFIDSVRTHGPYASALANVRDFADRFVPVRALSPQVLDEIASLGADPQLIYFDSNKLLDDLHVAHRLFPRAILAGDDWTWGAEQGYPVRTAVGEFCRQTGMRVKSVRATWALEEA